MTVPSTVPGETTLPELKAPPDFGGRAPEQPSDNPYVDDNDQSSGGSSDIKH